MNATIEMADAFLAEAKAGIDTGHITREDIEAYIQSADRLLSRHRQDLQVEMMVAAGQEAMQTLEELEQIRRLVAYGVALGRLGKDGMEFCRLMETRPPLDTAKGIRGITPGFEWLAANRSTLRHQLKNIIPSDTL